MRGERFTEERIIGVLQEADAGISVSELCRKYGVSETTIYNWKAKYGGLTVSEARRLKALKNENSRLRRLVADLKLDNEALTRMTSPPCPFRA